MDKILIDKVKINYTLRDVIPTDHGSTTSESLRKLEEQKLDKKKLDKVKLPKIRK